MSHNEFKTSEPTELQEASPMEKKLRVVGIDIAKQVFHLVGRDEQGTILVRKRLYRAQVMAFIAPAYGCGRSTLVQHYSRRA